MSTTAGVKYGKYDPLGMEGLDFFQEVGPRNPEVLNLGVGGLNPTALKGCAEIMKAAATETMVCLGFVYYNQSSYSVLSNQAIVTPGIGIDH